PRPLSTPPSGIRFSPVAFFHRHWVDGSGKREVRPVTDIFSGPTGGVSYPKIACTSSGCHDESCLVALAERGPFLPRVASMLNKMILTAILLTLSMGFLPRSALGADELPPRALARLGDYRFYHGPGIECAVLSPDGSRVASVGRYSDHNTQVSDQERQRYDCTIVVWDAATGDRIRELLAPRGPLSHLAFSADGRLLAAACGSYKTRESVAVFEAGSGKLLRHFGDFKSVNHLQFSAGGQQLRVCGWGRAAGRWDPAAGQKLRPR